MCLPQAGHQKEKGLGGEAEKLLFWFSTENSDAPLLRRVLLSCEEKGYSKELRRI